MRKLEDLNIGKKREMDPDFPAANCFYPDVNKPVVTLKHCDDLRMQAHMEGARLKLDYSCVNPEIANDPKGGFCKFSTVDPQAETRTRSISNDEGINHLFKGDW